MRARNPFLLTATFAIGLLGACAGPEDDVDLGEEESGGGSTPSGETIVRWNDNNFTILTTLDNGTASGLLLIRELAMVHIAMHDAANGAKSKYETYVLDDHDAGADPALAAAAAAHDVLVALRPGKAAQVDAFLQVDLARVSGATKRQKSLDLGAAAAEAIIALRASDGWFNVVPFTFGAPAPGVWQPVPPAGTNAVGTQIPFVTPFAVESASQFRPPGPPSLSSLKWKLDYNEVKEVGRNTSTTRTADQTHAALFWREQTQFAWNRIARLAATQVDKGLWQTARVFALVNMGLIDALITNFETKYNFPYWRPYTAIRDVDDGRSDTVMDPTWLPLNPTPGHPEFNSAQGVLGGAASYPLTQVYGLFFNFEMTTTTADPVGSTREYIGFNDAVIESALSRIWGGIHFRASTVAGGVEGLLIGKYVFDHELRPD
jgi:hypothetical protein